MEGGWLTAIKTHAHSIKGVAGQFGHGAVAGACCPPNRGRVLPLRKWIGSLRMGPLLWRSRSASWSWLLRLLMGQVV